MGGVAAALAEHAFEHLFIECLGWDRVHAAVTVAHRDVRLNLTAVAQKRGFTVFLCPAHRTVLANRRLLRDIQRQLRKSYHEHILIYSCETPRKQVWQWATTAEDGRRLLHREHPFFSSEPPPRLLERLQGLTVNIQEEEQTTLPDVLHRVRAALLPDSDLDLFAKYPSYAAESDRLAMAMKRGEPGALQTFVEFHMPLARHSSRMLIRWFDMDPDDASQTAMIGLLEAARRFDPDLGFQFSTYAGYWIRNACQRYGLEWGLPIHVPSHHFWACYKLEFVEAELIATYGVAEARQRMGQELAEAGVTPRQWQHFHIARHLLRFSELDKGQRAKLEKPISQWDVDRLALLRETMGRALQSLTPRQARILKLRYGFDEPERTLLEIAEMFGLSSERIRQLQNKAQKKLTGLLRKAGGQGELGHLPQEDEEATPMTKECP